MGVWTSLPNIIANKLSLEIHKIVIYDWPGISGRIGCQILSIPNVWSRNELVQPFLHNTIGHVGPVCNLHWVTKTHIIGTMAFNKYSQEPIIQTGM